MKIKFSKSRLDTQRDCLGKYYYTYIDKQKVEQRTWPGTLFGQALHSYLEENYSRITKEKDIKKMPLLSEYYEREVSSLDKSVKLGTPRGFEKESYIKEINKWAPEVLRFLFLFLPDGEKKFEEEINGVIEEEGIEFLINGFIDLQVQKEDNHIFDFKTTKHPNKFYFIHWDTDPQSLCYLWATKAKSFTYVVFDRDNKLILSTSRGEWRDEDEIKFRNLLKGFYKNHLLSKDPRSWEPNDDRCKWCDYKKICAARNGK